MPYRDEPAYHPSYGSKVLNGQLHPVWEAVGTFAPRALGPIIRSNGYPSPATLPAQVGGRGPLGYSASGGSGPAMNGPLLVVLFIMAAIGVFIVHHASFPK